MLVGAVGVAVSVASYPPLLSVLMAPIANAPGRPVDYPSAGYYVISLAPALALLVAAALAFLTRSRLRN